MNKVIRVPKGTLNKYDDKLGPKSTKGGKKSSIKRAEKLLKKAQPLAGGKVNPR